MQVYRRSQPQVRPAAARKQLRQAAVRLVLGHDRIVDDLVVLRLAEQRQLVRVKIETHRTVQMRNCRCAQAAAEVLEVLVVRDLAKFDFAAPAVPQQAPMFDADIAP